MYGAASPSAVGEHDAGEEAARPAASRPPEAAANPNTTRVPMTRRIRRRQPDLPPFSSPAPPVSIVIVTYRTQGRFIEKCLAALRRQDYPDYEVIVVDNASADETRETLERCRQDETIVLNDQNRGFGGGCNDGIARARGEIIVLLNFDTEVAEDWLSELVAPLVRERRVAVLGGIGTD